MDKQQLSSKIEKVRGQLVQTASHESLSSSKMQQISSRLDRLLNKYERLIKQQEHKVL
ncbi:aspartyl-phosphate phosphatase Spo0E family protein [Sporolactobacillus shoreae]|uniref:Aspartyl-phosphate phosphatase Spo0E family protein n=1 Tax=Sporolactobacillus shoreae TaxID=1465501 RepID=A0A4Z0GQI4_9BACL|nr:aspartyl-phosphate phosphatase Spo0E family protein [Sporolactobacillus shoreae]TGA99009.1 aspartyl-phosphate phosphatase Spo0E family protein [Sporolactobacillus shoreae]